MSSMHKTSRSSHFGWMSQCESCSPDRRAGSARRWRPDCARSAMWSIGLDPVAVAACRSWSARSPTATSCGGAIVDNGIDAIVHSGALHKPDIERRPREDFIEVNIRGTFNLLEEAVANGVGRFVFTSTTSLMISEAIRAGAGRRGGARRLADRGHGSRAAQHLWRHQALGRASVPALPSAVRAAGRSCCAPRGSSPRQTTWRMRSSSRTRTPRPTSSCSAA